MDFSNIEFDNVDLIDVIFDNCDLSNKCFDEKLLSRVVLKNAKYKKTKKEKSEIITVVGMVITGTSSIIGSLLLIFIEIKIMWSIVNLGIVVGLILVFCGQIRGSKDFF